MVPACSLCVSLEGGFEKGTIASACHSVWRKLSPSSHLDARHFSSSSYAVGAFQVATPVLELKWSESKFMYGFFKRNYLCLQKFLPPTQFPLVLEASSYRESSSCTGTLGWGAWCGAETPHF